MVNLNFFPSETIAKLQTTASFSRFELGHLQKQTPVALTFNELYFEVYQGLWATSHPETVLQRSQSDKLQNLRENESKVKPVWTMPNVSNLYKMRR